MASPISQEATAPAPSSNISLLRRTTTPPPYSLPFNFPLSSPLPALSLSFNPKTFAAIRGPAITEQEKALTPEEEYRRDLAKPCELYVCNLPRSCDVSKLFELFKPYGNIHSIQVSRDSETGVSRGCAYVTMCSVPEARSAIAALDGSDLDGREIRVKFSADMVPGRKNTKALTSAPKLGIIFESPHKAYVGNLEWSVRPEDLREHFSQYGTVVSARVLYDGKGGKNRVYGFLSFSNDEELKTALEASGSEYRGRELLVRKVIKGE